MTITPMRWGGASEVSQSDRLLWPKECLPETRFRPAGGASRFLFGFCSASVPLVVDGRLFSQLVVATRFPSTRCRQPRFQDGRLRTILPFSPARSQQTRSFGLRLRLPLRTKSVPDNQTNTVSGSQTPPFFRVVLSGAPLRRVPSATASSWPELSVGTLLPHGETYLPWPRVVRAGHRHRHRAGQTQTRADQGRQGKSTAGESMASPRLDRR